MGEIVTGVVTLAVLATVFGPMVIEAFKDAWRE